MTAPVSSALCFGKLPAHPDFVRYNAAGREALALDEWMHHGLYFARTQLGPGWEQEFAQTPSYRFVFNPETAQRSLAGVWQASRDKAERRYPFIVSLLLDRHWIRDSDAHLTPTAFSSFFEGAGQFIGRAMNGLEMRKIADETQALNCPEPDLQAVAARYAREFLDPLPIHSLWEELFGSFDDSRKYLVFSNLIDVLLPFRTRNVRGLGLGLRFPLLDGGSRADLSACFWLHVSLIMMGALPGQPFLFWSAAGNGMPAHLFLFFRQPSPKHFLQLVKPAAESENICPVDQGRTETLGRAAAMLPSRLRVLLDKREGSLGGFLTGLTGAMG